MSNVLTADFLIKKRTTKSFISAVSSNDPKRKNIRICLFSTILNFVRIIYQFLNLTFAVEVDEKLEFMI